MGDIIVSMLETILGGTFAGGTDSLATSVADYNSGAHDFARNVNDVAVKPIAASIVAIILTLELVRISSRYEGDSRSGTQVVAAAILKAVLLIIAIQNVDLILDAMNEVGELIIGNMANLNQEVRGQELSDDVRQTVKDMGNVDKAGMMIVLFFPFLLSIVAGFAVKIMIFIRFAELYILSAAATLPLAFLGNQETKSITIGYLRRYGGAVLHGVMIMVIISIYSFFQLDTLDLSAATSDNLLSTVMSQFASLLIGPVFFLFLIFGSSRLARSMLGDG